MLILSLQDLLQNQSLEIIQVYIAVLCFPHNSIVGIHLCAQRKRSKRFKSLSQGFVHLATARASIFTDHKMSGLPIRARYTHLRTICEQTVDN